MTHNIIYITLVRVGSKRIEFAATGGASTKIGLQRYRLTSFSTLGFSQIIQLTEEELLTSMLFFITFSEKKIIYPMYFNFTLKIVLTSLSYSAAILY